MEQKLIKRFILEKDFEGNKYGTLLNYTATFKDGRLVNIINENNFTVEKNSDCWEYFLNKFSKNG